MKYGLSFEKIFHHPPLHIAMYEMLLRTIVKVNKIQNVIAFSLRKVNICSKKYRTFIKFRPKMTIFQRVGIREGGLSLPLAFQYS